MFPIPGWGTRDAGSKKLMRHLVHMLVTATAVILATSTARAGDESLSPWRRDSGSGALQKQLDALKPGQTLELPAGEYEGPITLRVPGVTLKGNGEVIIDGGGTGTVISVRADGVTLSGLRIRGSGESNPLVHAAVSIDSVADIKLLNSVLEDSLFGVDISNCQRVLVQGCEISSKPMRKTFRGDALRIWHSKDVDIIKNHWHDARDAVCWYSDNVRFIENVGEQSRYSVHGMYSKNIFLKGNRFVGNSVGIFLMYGSGSTIVDNLVRESSGSTGIGLGLKETSGVYARNNRFVYCATGVLVDNSPWEPDSRNWFHNNTLAFNGAGILLANDRAGNEFKGNMFHSNRVDVDTEARRSSPGQWLHNRWDSYEGFDRNNDGIGDTPHVPRRYGDVLTGTHPATQFFRGSPILVLISLLERLVPLSEPIALLRDPEPRFGGGEEESDD